MKPKSTLRSFLAMASSTLITITYASANTYYWDSNDTVLGFGAVNAVWTGTTNGTATSGWSTDPEGDGATIVGNSVTTDASTNDAVNFGTNTTPYTGTITFSGPLSVKSIYACPTHGSFVAASSPVITFGAEGIFESASGGIQGLPAVTFAGAATSLTIRSGRTVQLANITNNIPASSKIILETSPDSPNLPLNGRTQITSDTLAFATGSITYGTPVDGDTVTVNGVVLTKAAVAGAAEFTSITELNALVTAISGVDSTENGTVVSITAATAGKEGNAITLAEVGAMTVSGATLTGGLTPQLGVGTDLEFNGGTLRFATTLPFASLSALNTAHPVTFISGANAGFDNQINSTTFTVDQSVNLGSGKFYTEGSTSGLIKLTQPNTWAELRLVAGTCEIDNLNQLGTAVRWGSSGVAGGNGTLRILGPITSFGAVTMLFTTDKGVGLDIADVANTFTVNQALTQGLGGFSKSGAGTLNLDMTATSSTYTGNTNVNGGTMNLSNMPGTATTASVQAGTLVISGTNTHTGILSCNTTGTLTLSGNNSGAGGGVTLTAGTLNLDSTSALGSGPFTVTAGTINNTVATAGNNTVNFNGSFAWQGVTDLTFGNGAITNAGNRTITLNAGPGRTLTFGGIMSSTANAVQTTTVNGAGNTLVLAGYNLQALNTTNRINVINGSGTVTISGEVSNGLTATSGLTYGGTGTLNLNGNNTYDGLTSVTTAAGTLNLNGDNSSAAGGVTLNFATAALNVNSLTALGTGTVTLTAGTFNNTSGTPKSLSTNNLVVLAGNTTWGGANNLTFGTGDIQISGTGRVITLTNSGTLTFGGKLVNTLANNTIFSVSGLGKTMTAAGLACSNTAATRTFTVQGDGNLTITGAVNGSSFAGSENIASPLTMNGTGTLTLQGTNTHTGLTSVTAAGTLAGNGNYAGSVTIGATGTHRLAVAATAGAQDTSVITGTLTLTAGNILNLTAAATPAAGVYVLATASVAITGTPTTITGTPAGGTVTVDTVSTPKRLLLTVTAGYASWKGANAGGQNPDEDFDNDGVDNGVEYFMNAAAGFTASPALNSSNVITWTNGGNILPAAYGTEYVIQTSSDLSTWADVLVGDLTTNTAGPGGSLTYTLTGASPRFVRLKVTPN